jgi:hypothetical protein
VPSLGLVRGDGQMQVTHVAVPAPGAVNEDFVVLGQNWIVVLDGATPKAGVESGCVHSVRWLVEHLGISLAQALTLTPDLSLIDALAEAIFQVCVAHQDTCDLANPDSPSSTAVMLRHRGGELEYLVLGDSPLLLDVEGVVQVVTDDRSAHLPSYTAEGVRAARNQPGGFWIASTKPEAAHHAIAGSVPVQGVRRAALLSDGASRYVERLGFGTWTDLLDLIVRLGPAELVRVVRAAELAQLPAAGQEPNGRVVKRHDDATAVLIQF